MEMTIKNKMLLAMDVLIEETKKNGGVPKDILLAPNEAMHFILESGMLTPLKKNQISAKRKDDNGFDIRFLLKPSLTKEEAIAIVQRWYAGEFTLEYNGVSVVVIPKSRTDDRAAIVAPPEPPIGRFISEVVTGECGKCGSSVHRKWGFLRVDGCIQPQCQNYWKNY